MFQGELCQNITAKAIESVRGVSNLVDITKHPSYKVRYISESVILRPKPGGRRREERKREGSKGNFFSVHSPLARAFGHNVL